MLNILCLPCRATFLLPLRFCSFSHPLLESQILGKTPAICKWTKQLHRNCNRNKEDSLSDVMDGPRPLLVLSICLSLSYKEENMSSLNAEFGYQSVLPFQPASRISPYSMRRETYWFWREREHSWLSSALHVCPQVQSNIGEIPPCLVSLNSNAGPGKFPPSSWTHICKLAEPAPSSSEAQPAHSRAWEDLGSSYPALSSLNTYLSLIRADAKYQDSSALAQRIESMWAYRFPCLPLSISTGASLRLLCFYDSASQSFFQPCSPKMLCKTCFLFSLIN